MIKMLFKHVMFPSSRPGVSPEHCPEILTNNNKKKTIKSPQKKRKSDMFRKYSQGAQLSISLA